jgi:16S rRNA pseudouridine516 synthase
MVLTIKKEFIYLIMNKPQGVVSSTEKRPSKTVIDLLPEEYKKFEPFPVGRLDKDTEGLLLITNDGELSHALLSPKKHVPKTYLVQIPERLNAEQIQKLEDGVDIGDEKLTMPAEVQMVDDEHILLTIKEGRYHQVKRMLATVGSQVLYLKRITFGALVLDVALEKGAYRALTEDEIAQLRQKDKTFD